MSVELVGTLLPRAPAEAAAVLRQPPPGADWVELRLDALAEPTRATVQKLLALPRSIPVLVACRPSAASDGHPLLDDAARLALLAVAGEAGADLIDVEDGLLERFPASVPGQRLASCHLGKFAPRLSALARRVAGRGAAYGKLAVPADTPRQLAELLALQEEIGRAVSIVPTGRLAEAGRVMLAGRGAALSYGALDPTQPGHPDQPALARLHDIFHVETVGPSTRFFAVVARPVAHSLSPAWHNSVFRAVGQDARLVALEVERIADVLDSADALRLDGFAVSHPLKQEALVAAASHLPGALAARAANTLLRTPAGWQARNTDWKAAVELLPKLLRGWRKAHAGQVPKVLLLGSGGAARAVAMALGDQEVELAVWSRRLAHAKALADELRDTLPAIAVPEPGHAPADLVINATPVGSPGAEPSEMKITAALFREGALAVDLAYGGSASPFRRAATLAGAQLTPGEDFFCLQARRQSEIFTGAAVGEEVRAAAARACGLG
jgi:3-dehydroquinate dehydratase / shikimate dehydrogenase